MTTPRWRCQQAFNRAAFLTGYRAVCEARDYDPATGNPSTADSGWWRNPALWVDGGTPHSSTEAEALSRIARQARASAGQIEPAAETTLLRPSLADEVAILAGEGALRAFIPLRELHARRGVVVESVLGQRMEVPIKARAG